jgi:hypothetical protein
MPYKNIDPTIWGPYLWKFMHYLTLAYPDNPTEDDKNNLFNFFDSVKEVIPCEKCRHNFQVHLETSPLTEEILEDNVKVVKWLYNIHNNVNKALNKPILPYDDFIKEYTITSNTSNTSNTPDKTLEEIKKELREELRKELREEVKLELIKETDKNVKEPKNNINIIDTIKNNKLILLIIIFVILAILIYINKKY